MVVFRMKNLGGKFETQLLASSVGCVVNIHTAGPGFEPSLVKIFFGLLIRPMAIYMAGPSDVAWARAADLILVRACVIGNSFFCRGSGTFFRKEET